MKRILHFTALLLFTFSINTFAQRMAETGNNWNVLDVVWLSGWTNNYSIGLDTIVNGITYKQVFINDELGGTYYTAPRFVRETEDGKVFSQDNVRGEVDEILLYDFGLQLGDTFQIGYPHSPWGGGVLTVSSVDTIVLSDGISRRRLILEDMNQWNNDSITWIEGIGDIGLGPFYAHLFYWTDSWAQLLCTYQ